MTEPRIDDDRGQTIVLVALLGSILMGFIGLAVDIAWHQTNINKIQRTADAAALAGAVYLPGNVSGAQAAALASTAQNGYVNGTGGVTVIAAVAAGNANMMTVTVSAPVRTWFMRIFSIRSLTATRNARAEFILPVPMGSPQAYFGIQRLCRNADDPTAALPGGCPEVTSASGAGTLTTQGFWATVESKGLDRAQGDAYSTYYNGTYHGPALNTGFDGNGYSYIIDLPTGVVNGKVWIYDPMFCATGRRTTSPNQRLGVGDFWIWVNPSTADGRRVSTQYKLWDMNGTPYSTIDDVAVSGADSGTLFHNDDHVDKGAASVYKGDGVYDIVSGYTGGSSADCSASQYHNAWWLLKSGLGAGQYRLQVTTNVGTNPLSQNGVNGFGIEVTADSGLGDAQVYGQSRMCILVNVPGTSATFYLAQISAVHAGKTLEIKLFDPGDFLDTILRIKKPKEDLTGYEDASFTFTTTGSACCSAPTTGGPQTSIRTSAVSGSPSNYYNNHWITLSVVIPTDYTAPQPAGEPGPGWWKIQYTTGSSGIDITTWEVNIRGNPVHLVTP